ncbi:ATP-binding protein [Marinobacteraceae bacterium S3BR75-40.1]
MKIDVKKRLSFRLTRDTVLLALVLGVFLNLVQVTIDYFNASRNMDEEIRALMDISHSPASQIAYNIDTRLAEELLEGLLQHPAIVQARIVDPDGRILAERQRQLPNSPYRWLSDLLFGPERRYEEQLRVPQLAEIDLGKLFVVIDTYYYGTSFLNRALYTLLSGFIKSLILSVILLFVFYLVLTKPLLKVIQSLSSVDAEAPEKVRLPTPSGHDEDEIGLLVRITNEHLDSIDGNLQKLRQAEGRLKTYNEQLAQIVEARTREISDKNTALERSNRALIDAKEDALARARARADFLASMSHEIRTPLNGLLGMLSLAMEDDDLPASQRNRLEIAHNAGYSLLNLLNDILDISKVEAGKLELEQIEFNLRHLGEECASLLAEQGQRKGVDVVTDIDPDLPENFVGDPTRLRQIINNLLGNGIKFTPKGNVTLGIRHQGENTLITVTDTGIGLSEADQRKIFSPFAQAHTDTARRFGGTGLGLTLCRQLVERMHGQIRLESEENEGTTFEVSLPLKVPVTEVERLPGTSDFAGKCVCLWMAPDNPHRPPLERQLKAWHLIVSDAPQEAEVLLAAFPLPEGCDLTRVPQDVPIVQLGTGDSGECSNRIRGHIALPLVRRQLSKTLVQVLTPETTREEEDVSSEQATPQEMPKMRILLVEDNRVNQIVASGMLRKLGHDVELAENGERALVALKQRPFDMVLMDCQMPVMDGFEATRRIRGEMNLKQIPIIAVTANVMRGDREQCLRAGMNDYITKPYSLDSLRQTLSRWALAKVPQ